MRESQHLPDGVSVCESCQELYTEELTLSDFCEVCEFYGDEAVFDFGDVDTDLEIDDDGEITDAAIANRNRLLDEMIRREGRDHAGGHTPATSGNG